jgi:hypothetical protein
VPEDSDTHHASTTSMQGPFRLASFSFRRVSDSSNSVAEELNQLAQQSAAKVESMNLTLERLKEQARGFLSFTGAPQLIPIAHSVTGSRYLILCAMCFAVWGLAWWVLSPNRMASRATRFLTRGNTKKWLPSTSQELTGAWLRSMGIQYLGEIKLSAEDLGTVESSKLAIQSKPVDEVSGMHDFKRRTAQFIRVSCDRLLVVWVVAFVLRLALDAPWRELVGMAPLAGISRLLFGVA